MKVSELARLMLKMGIEDEVYIQTRDSIEKLGKVVIDNQTGEHVLIGQTTLELL